MIKNSLTDKIDTTTKQMIKFGNFRKARFGRWSINTLVVVMFIAAGLLYVVAVNVASTKGSYLQTLQLQKQSIVAGNERLALEAARLASLAVIEGGAKEKIEIGEDGKPTGRVLSEPDSSQTKPTDKPGEKKEELTYLPKMIPMGEIGYLDSSTDFLAQR